MLVSVRFAVTFGETSYLTSAPTFTCHGSWYLPRLSNEPVSDGGSRVDGTIAEIVYLGMYTQFHVDTPAGRVVSHRLAGETVTTLGLESRVVLSWEPEHTSVLDDVAASTGSL